jgi:hypothetical protein
MKQALISSAAAILIAVGGTVGVGWYLSSPPPERAQPDVIAKLPELPEGLEIAWRCDGMIIAIIEKELEGISRGGTYMANDIERTVWIYNPLRLPLPTKFMFKQYETAHPYSTWDAELIGGECQAVYHGSKDRLLEVMRNLPKIVRLEKSDEFKRCLKENPDKHEMCRDVAEEKLKTKERSP